MAPSEKISRRKTQIKYGSVRGWVWLQLMFTIFNVELPNLQIFDTRLVFVQKAINPKENRSTHKTSW
ncbi:MAG: hypothetical protein QOH96_2096 [Blastocatellia bacterium]|jgi:hypothetical protein|nr:hypothetical protein [Blastocatellia bacterium]